MISSENSCYFYFKAEYNLFPDSKVSCYYRQDKLCYECTLVAEDENKNWTVSWADGDNSDTTNHPVGHIQKIIFTQEVNYFKSLLHYRSKQDLSRSTNAPRTMDHVTIGQKDDRAIGR